VREIYEQRKKEFDYVAIMGDFKDTPDSVPLKHLIHDGSDLVEVMTEPGFDNGGLPGTYGECGTDNKIDYILMSPKLAGKFKTGGVERHGIWPGKKGTKFPHWPMKSAVEAASDHAGLWAEFDLKAA
jgi:endonuclease/exonuclease/phosphatase family metal-dependent hydrolase